MANTELQKLSARHDFVIKLHIEGLNNRDIARQTGFIEEHVPVIINSPIAQERIRKVKDALTDDHIEALNLARRLAVEATPHLSKHLIDLALGAQKQDTQLSATVQALKFAEGGISGEQVGQTAINIYVKGENGETKKKADIFEGAAFVEEDNKAGSKALALAEGTEVLDEQDD